ncbi:MAG: hypothetical protein ACOC80_15575, partial [Petrotogales bacterium]
GEWYCLQCAAELKELEEKSNKLKSHGKNPEVLALSIENPGLPIVRYFQMITTTGIIHMGTCDNYKNEPDESTGEIVATVMEGVYYKLLENLEEKAYQLGANTILGVKVSTTSFSTIGEEFGLIVTLTGTPVLTARKKEKSTEEKEETTQEKERVSRDNEFDFSNDFFNENFEQIEKTEN